MQPQDNLPQDQSMGGGQGAADPMSNQATPMGGATFQPQTNPQVPAVPNWQNDAAADAHQLYSQPEQAADAAQGPGMPPNPLLNDNHAPAPDAAMQQDFNQAANLAAPTAAPVTPAGPAPMDNTTSQMPQNPLLNETPPSTPAPASPLVAPTEAPAAGMPVQPTQQMAPPMPQSEPAPVPPMAEPAPLLPPDMSQAPVQPELYPQQPSGLPGSDQLGAAAAGMDQPMPTQGGIDPRLAQAADMGAYGPPPRNNKKILFIIIGAVIGIAAIAGIVLFITNSSKNKQASQNLTTTTQQPQTTSTPNSGPATPPENYVTIDKQCYTFALYNPNTVPTDQTCSFENATFGKLKTSVISVITTTESLKTIDDYFSLVKPNVTVVSEESVKLDNTDAKQLIYKASDGKTYSEVAGLVVGKNYQQDGKAVTGISIKTTY